jgi:hypothetical protein
MMVAVLDENGREQYWHVRFAKATSSLPLHERKAAASSMRFVSAGRMDLHGSTGINHVKQLDDVPVAHPDA